MEPEILYILVKNILAGLAAFIGIAVWTKTRDSAWIFIVLSVLFSLSALPNRLSKHKIIGHLPVPAAFCGLPGQNVLNCSYSYYNEILFLFLIKSTNVFFKASR